MKSPCQCGPSAQPCGCDCESEPVQKSCHTCGSCGCRCAPTEKVATLLDCKLKIMLEPDAKGIVIPQTCGCGAAPLTDLWLWVRRRGTSEWIVKYPAWDHDEFGDVVFLFDQYLTNQPPGRYEGELRTGKACCATIEFTKPKPCGKPPTRVLPLAASTQCYSNSAPEGDMGTFDCISTFCGSLCGVLERGVKSLPLCDDDLMKLCGITPLCCPAQLVITDGARSEVVLFSGCSNGQVLVDRAVDGGPQYRFPPGSTIKFEWTGANAQQAVAGCGPGTQAAPWVIV